MTQTPNDITALHPNSIRQLLEQHLQERLDRNAELAPRALPTLDPVAYQAVASNRLVIGQISAALNRLDAGTYGLCTRCGSPIAPARLEVVPYAGACIQCQSLAEAA